MFKLPLILILSALITYITAANLAVVGVHLDEASRNVLARNNAIAIILLSADVIALILIHPSRKSPPWPDSPP